MMTFDIAKIIAAMVAPFAAAFGAAWQQTGKLGYSALQGLLAAISAVIALFARKPGSRE